MEEEILTLRRFIYDFIIRLGCDVKYITTSSEMRDEGKESSKLLSAANRWKKAPMFEKIGGNQTDWMKEKIEKTFKKL